MGPLHPVSAEACRRPHKNLDMNPRDRLLQSGANIGGWAATNQFVIDIVIENDSLAGTGALYVLAEIDLRVIRSPLGSLNSEKSHVLLIGM